MTPIGYQDAMLQLLPPGAAWPREPDSIFGQLMLALGDEFARVDGRIDNLIDEADPRTTLEMLADWERVAGLPDACAGAPDSIGERRIALVNKLAQRGEQSIPYFTAIASRLGYYVEIIETDALKAGFRAGALCNGDAWCFAWIVHVVVGSAEYLASYAQFRVGSRAGERLRGFSALNLECLIRRAKPAHSEVMFIYEVEPAPTLWFDFIEED